MPQIFNNNATGVLASSKPAGATLMLLSPGQGAAFPQPENGDFFTLTLFKIINGAEANFEVVRCTARNNDFFTIVGAQEGTAPATFAAGDQVSMRLTAKWLNETETVKTDLPVLTSQLLPVTSPPGAKGDGTTDDTSAVIQAKNDSGKLHFPRMQNKATTYLMGGFQPNSLSGTSISADKDVTLSLGSNQYNIYKGVDMSSDAKVFFRDINSSYIFPTTPSQHKKDALPMLVPAQAVKYTALNCLDGRQVSAREVIWDTRDDFTDSPVTRSSDTMSFAARDDAVFRGAFVDLGPYETINAYFENGVSSGPIGVILQGTSGFSVVYSNTGDDNYFFAEKLKGQPVQGNTASLSWGTLGQGAYQSFRAENSVWSVTRIDEAKVVIALNGKALTRPSLQALGDLVSVGFVTFGKNAFDVSGLTAVRRTDAVVGSQVLEEIRVFGDSTAESFPGSWDQYLTQMMDGVAGVRLNNVSNYAVAGTTLDEAFASMQANGFGNATYVVVCGATNNVQMQTNLADFKTLARNVIDYIKGQGRRPVIIIPGMWYMRAQANGVGQDSSNYEKGAPYRMALIRIAAEKQALICNTPWEVPNPSPSYRSGNRPLLRDNIHQDVLMYQFYARMVSQVILDDYLSMPGCVEVRVNEDMFLNGASDASGVRLTIDKQGVGKIGGTVNVTSADPQEIMELPRWCAPTHDMSIMALGYSAGGGANLGACYLSYSTASNRLTVRGAPAGTVILVIQTTSFKTI